MAERVYTVLVSDISGEELLEGSGERLTFAVRGVEYEIDLTEKEAAAFDKAISPYLTNARRVGGRKRSTTASSASASRERSRTIRQWAKDQGMDVPPHAVAYRLPWCPRTRLPTRPSALQASR